MKYFLACVVLFHCALSASSQGVKISENPGTPDPSAILEVSSTSQVFLPPRLTSAQRDAISSPASGLIIYNTTTRCLQTFISPVWQNIYCGCDPPAAPVADAHTSTTSQITWNWTEVPDALGYKFNTTDEYESATDNGTSTTFVQSGLTCDSPYTLYLWSYSSCGNSEVAEFSQATLVCCDSGDLTPAFGSAGVVTNNISSGNDAPRAMTRNTSGLYIAGYYEIGSGDYAWRMEKRNQITGVLIDGFGSGGAVSSNPSTGDDACWDIVSDESGLFIGGMDRTSSDMKWRIEKRDLDTGALISGFGSGGVVTSNPSGSTDQILGMTLDGTGIYAGGSDNSLGNLRWRIEKRSLTDGSLIWTQTANPSSTGDEIWGLAVNESALFAAGYDNSLGNQQWRIEKRSVSSGDLIGAFGSSGVITSNPSNANDQIRSIAIDDSGLYVGGFDASPGNDQWRIEKRDLTSGALISAFGTGGVLTLNPGSGSDAVLTLIVDEDGLYLTGSDSSLGNGQWRTELRDLTTGSLIWSQTSNPSSVDDVPAGLTTDEDHVYISGRDQAPGNNQWRIEKRCK